MKETGLRDLEQKARERFHKTGLVCYDRWRRSDLFEVALDTMPKSARPQP